MTKRKHERLIQPFHPMQQYHDLMEHVLTNGVLQQNRTGIPTYMIPGAMLKFDMNDGFPLVTTKKMYVKQTIGELIGFLRGATSAAEFRELGCTFWDANANKDGVSATGEVVPNKWLSNPNRKGEDDLGRIYGAQWRDWKGVVDEPSQRMTGTNTLRLSQYDQIQNVLTKLILDPTDRRMIVSAWRPDEIDQMALPPCHVMHQFIADPVNMRLHMTMYQRSCDLFLGSAHNIASYAMWLHVMAALTEYYPGTFTYFLADAHIYKNHVDQVSEQLLREHYPQPHFQYVGPGSRDWELKNKTQTPTFMKDGFYIPDFTEIAKAMKPEHFVIQDYLSHGPIKADMAV